MSTVDIDKAELRRLWSMQEDLGYSSFDQFAEDIAKLLAANTTHLKAELLAKIEQTLLDNEQNLLDDERGNYYITQDTLTKLIEEL